MSAPSAPRPASRPTAGDVPGGATHRPVMLGQVLAALAPRDGAIYLDATFGAGGYSSALLDAADCAVWGIDRDPDTISRGVALQERYLGRFTVIEGRFGDMDALLAARGISAVDGIAFDLGTSSMQLDEPRRGFSFHRDGPLDMRMSRSGRSAAEIVNSLDETPLGDIIRRYGEERGARRIARAIVEARRGAPITRTRQLAELVRGAVPPRRGRGHHRIDPATRTFQALRIHVNDEIGELRRGLDAAEALLAPGGRLAVVSFHSLEDREVKNFLKERAGRRPRGSRHLPEAGAAGRAATFALMSRRALKPARDEVVANPRARSARLRTARRTDAPAWTRPGTGADGLAARPC